MRLWSSAAPCTRTPGPGSSAPAASCVRSVCLGRWPTRASMGSGETPRQQRDGRCDVSAARARCGRGAPGTGSRVGHRALRGAPASVPPRAGRRAYRMCKHAAMVANGPMLRLLPRLSDDVAFYWTAGADGVLRLLHCNACGFFIHPPGPVCPRCLSRDLAPEGGQRPRPRGDLHRQLPAVDTGQRHLHHRLGVDRRAARACA